MKLLIEIHLDGYETKEEHNKACLEFVYDQLNMTASSVKILKVENE